MYNENINQFRATELGGEKMSRQQESYLKVIYDLMLRYGHASNKKIAEDLNVAPASVTEMVRKLKENNWVQVSFHKITLTPEGEARVKNLLDRHRLWETFLLTKLDYPPDLVHDLAESLEHASDSQLIDRLNKYLAYPETCPHGGPIYVNGGCEARESLWGKEDQGPFEIVQIIDELNYKHYERRGLLPGAQVELKKKFSENMTVSLEGKKATLSKEEAENILVVKNSQEA